MKKETVAHVVARHIELCKAKGKTQKEIAIKVGFPKVNMITHIKQGKSKLPPNRAPALAEAIGVDPEYLLRLALNERWADAQIEGMKIGDYIFKNIHYFKMAPLIEEVFWEVLKKYGVEYETLSKQEQINLYWDVKNLVRQTYNKYFSNK